MNPPYTLQLLDKIFILLKRVLILALSLIWVLLPVTIEAAEQVASVHLSNGHEGTTVSLYYAAVNENGQYQATQAFQDSKVDFTQSGEADASHLAGTLYAHIRSKNIEPSHTVTLDENGEAILTNIPVGYYLITSERYQVNDKDFYINPSLLELNPDDERKITLKTQSYVTETDVIQVEKIWKDENGKIMEEPPQSEVVAQFLRDGTVAGARELNEANHWQEIWSVTQPDHWTVMEKDIPEGYKLTIEQDGNLFRLINQKESGTSETPDQPNSKTPPPSENNSSTPSKKAGTANTAANTKIEIYSLMALGASAGIFLMYFKIRRNKSTSMTREG